MSYADRTLTCRDCGTEFVFTAGEQEFYAQKGFTNEPTRCQSCRQTRKSGGGGGGGYSNRDSYGGRDDSYNSRPREMHYCHLRIMRQGGPGAVRAAWG